MNPGTPILTAICPPALARSPRWALAIWAPPVVVLAGWLASLIVDWVGGPVPFGIAYPGVESEEQSLGAWLNLIAMTGGSMVLSWYGCLRLLAVRHASDASSLRTWAAGVAAGVMIAMIVGLIHASDRTRNNEQLVAWMIGAYGPTLALSYGLLGSGVARLRSRRLGIVTLAAFPFLVVLTQICYLPGDGEREVVLAFILNALLIALAIGARLAIWFQEDEPACAPRKS